MKHGHFKMSVALMSDTCRTPTLARHLPNTYRALWYRVEF